jgi:hypothetical protein
MDVTQKGGVSRPIYIQIFFIVLVCRTHPYICAALPQKKVLLVLIDKKVVDPRADFGVVYICILKTSYLLHH